MKDVKMFIQFFWGKNNFYNDLFKVDISKDIIYSKRHNVWMKLKVR